MLGGDFRCLAMPAALLCLLPACMAAMPTVGDPLLLLPVFFERLDSRDAARELAEHDSHGG